VVWVENDFLGWVMKFNVKSREEEGVEAYGVDVVVGGRNF
jgi:hypothetical protein